ncbi:hypothetical protein U1Q18_029162 [Sarracenia purpurea var. burkii]
MSSQQPVVVYPNTVTKQPLSGSTGSVGTVFVVLAAIIAGSVIICFLGWLCSRRNHRRTAAKQSQGFRTREREVNAMSSGNNNGEAKGARPAGTGGINGEPRFSSEGELKLAGRQSPA